ncbi:MAG: multidrug MFS transporter [Legionellales bacterium RIFCSPHIGHO2_12_FULL_42_9]|nr:MAG: multidrug MFS transporter [Legionellales bacterium RIFCSPHIGHO2_12_FULL_42_9]
MSNSMSFLHKLYKKLPVLIFDCTAIPAAWYGAFWLRHNMHHFSGRSSLFGFVVLFVIQITCYYCFKVYRGLWRFSSINDVVRIIKAVTSTTFLAIPVFYLTSVLPQVPRSIFPMYGLILVTILCSGRLARRTYREGLVLQGRENFAKRVLIIGAGQAGESLVRDLKRTSNYWPIGFVDDNPTRRDMEIHGVAVLGTIAELSDIVKTKQIDLIIIAIPSARSAEMRRIVGYCEGCPVSFQTLPSLSVLVSGQSKVNALRDVNIEDLLGRGEVHLEWDKITHSIKNKRVLVTGGGGSIGSELCRQIMRLQPDELLIIDNSEYNLYQIELELRAKHPDVSLKVGLLSVTDQKGIDACFTQFKPTIVFHAAAYKHVPMLEQQTRVAALNNVIGTQVIAEMSARMKVEKFVLISSDKAVNPANVMGATKRVAEIFCQNFNEQVETQFITVRFGNVLGSSGSVVPLFQKQIEAGGPVTVTHPDITRYFMTIPEACQLILQAMTNGHGGEIFVLDMGEPIKISYLAEQMIKLAGKEHDQEIVIQYTGLRAGEKLFEEIFHASEKLVPTEHEKLFKARFRRFDWQELIDTFHLLNTACNTHEEEEIFILLKSLVPEFTTERVVSQSEVQV